MEQKSTFLPALQFGLLTGLAMIVFSLILYLAGVDIKSYLNLFGYVLFVGGLYWGITSIREKQLEGIMTYGKAFGTGFWISVFVAILLGIFAFFYLKYINPSVLADKLTEIQNKIVTSNPKISDADLQKSMDMIKIFSTPLVSAFTGFLSYFFPDYCYFCQA